MQFESMPLEKLLFVFCLLLGILGEEAGIYIYISKVTPPQKKKHFLLFFNLYFVLDHSVKDFFVYEKHGSFYALLVQAGKEMRKKEIIKNTVPPPSNQNK